MKRDSVANTFIVATTLCVICSVLVSGAAVSLRSIQEKQKKREERKNVLIAAGLYQDDVPIDQLFAQIESQIVNLATGEFVADSEIDATTFDPRAAAKDRLTSVAVSPGEDPANIKRRETHAFVYLVKNNDDRLAQIVLPIRGMGLWSTLYGFLALDADTRTIRGLTFFEHGETPGLGGEVDNPKWKAQWHGKIAFDPEWNIRIKVIKGTVDRDRPDSIYQVDGLSGATITSRGVTNMLRYWLGDHAFGPFLEQIRVQGQEDGQDKSP